jgi:hypothetical protein
MTNPVWFEIAHALALCGPSSSFSASLGAPAVAQPKEFVASYAAMSPLHAVASRACRLFVWFALMGVVLLNQLRNRTNPRVYRDGYRIGESWGKLIPADFSHIYLTPTPQRRC